MTEDRAKSRQLIDAATEVVGGRKSTHTRCGMFADRYFRMGISVDVHDGDFSMQAREYSEILIVLGGTATHVTPVECHLLEAGDVFVIHSPNPYGFRAAKGLKLCNIVFDPRQFRRDQRRLGDMKGWHALFEPAPSKGRPELFRKHLHLTSSEFDYGSAITAAMKDEYEHRKEGFQGALAGYFLLLVTFLCRVYGRSGKEQNIAPVRFAHVMAHIQQNLGEPLRLNGLAALACLSVRQFEREFERFYSMTPLNFIKQLRLQEACERLRNPDRDVTDVAVELGYCSLSYFSKQFKAAFGHTPSAYRLRQLTELGQSRSSQMTKALSEGNEHTRLARKPAL